MCLDTDLLLYRMQAHAGVLHALGFGRSHPATPAEPGAVLYVAITTRKKHKNQHASL